MSVCPVCGSGNQMDVFAAKGRPRYALQRHTTRHSALTCETEDVAFVFCLDCQFTFNSIFRPMDYVEDIDTSRRHSETFNRWLRSVCEEVGRLCSIEGKLVVEIGCGDGQFLSELRRLYEFEGWGFDPSLTRTREIPAFGDLRFVPATFDAGSLQRPPHLIVLRHIMEHIASAKTFLPPIVDGPHGLPSWIYVEVPDWGWIVENDQIMMFSNDHCSYYSKKSLERAMASCGFHVDRIQVTFDREYLQYFGRGDSQGSASAAGSSTDGDCMLERTKDFAARIPRVLERFKGYFTLGSGQSVLWGAGGKGTVLLSTLGVGHEDLPFVVDSNPNRHHTFVPVTGQEVIAPEALREIRPRFVLITNPGYRREIAGQLAALGVDAEIVQLQ